MSEKLILPNEVDCRKQNYLFREKSLIRNAVNHGIIPICRACISYRES